MEIEGRLGIMEEGRSALKISGGKPTGKRPLGSPRLRWQNNIRIGLKNTCQYEELV